ncbi:ABC-type polar amino acid transport system ATPase subunit [Clostridium saccharobutylicum]|nr:ABC-type polar amino acid transport system ATPase subunit [Clostridium saccharobutylicum]
MNEVILETKKLCKTFKKQEAIKDISISVQKKFNIWTAWTKWSWKIYIIKDDYRNA